jgi:hypothetical protein
MDINSLTLFNERVARLNRSKLAERMKNTSYVLSFDRFTNGEWICADGVDEDTVDAFILNVRLLIQDNDGFSIKCLAENIYSKSAVPDDLRGRFQNARKKWQEHAEAISLFKHPCREGSFSNRELFDVLMYGGLAHANRDKVDLFFRLTRSGAISALVFYHFLKSLQLMHEVVNTIADVNEELAKIHCANK